eukprot:362589-Chlamydomonas_euryale.AAC.12
MVSVSEEGGAGMGDVGEEGGAGMGDVGEEGGAGMAGVGEEGGAGMGDVGEWQGWNIGWKCMLADEHAHTQILIQGSELRRVPACLTPAALTPRFSDAHAASHPKLVRDSFLGYLPYHC